MPLPDLPEGVLHALAAGDLLLARDLLDRAARSQLDHADIKWTRAAQRLESVFTEVTGRKPWEQVRIGDIGIYRKRVGDFARYLGVDTLIRDIRSHPHAKSMKYFVAPGRAENPHPARWEMLKLDLYERTLQREQEQRAMELNAAAALLQSGGVVEEVIPLWVASSVDEAYRYLNGLRTPENTARVKKIARRLAGHGWNLTWSHDPEDGHYLVHAKPLEATHAG